MKKLFSKDNYHRKIVQKQELKKFVLKQLSVNQNITKMSNWSNLVQLMCFSKKSSKIYLTNRCIKTTNKKAFHKFSNFSRVVFFRLIKLGSISGLRKSSW